ncbi:MAG: PAS domain S-box protein [Gemmatimonadota bacterium]
MSSLPSLPSRLAQVRKQTGLGQRGFAAALFQSTGYRVSHTTVGNYESGTHVPAAYVAAVSSTFGISPSWLLTGTGLPVDPDPGASQKALEAMVRALGEALPGMPFGKSQLDTFFRVAPDPLVVLTPEGHLTRWNPALEKVLGVERGTLEGTLLLHWVADDARAACTELLARMEGPGHPARSHLPLKTKTGELHHTECHAARAHGLIFAVLRSLPEYEWRERTRKLAAAVEHSGDCVLITDRDGIIEYVNPAFTRTTGYAPEEAVGRNPRILRSGIHDEEFYQRLWQTIQKGDVFRTVFVNRKKSGELYRDHRTIAPVLDDKGRITHFVATGRDMGPFAEREDTLRVSGDA